MKGCKIICGKFHEGLSNKYADQHKFFRRISWLIFVMAQSGYLAWRHLETCQEITNWLSET